MTSMEIISQLKRLNSVELLSIIENASAALEAKLNAGRKTKYRSKSLTLKTAARKLLAEYKSNRDLTAFTAIDSDEFYAQG